MDKKVLSKEELQKIKEFQEKESEIIVRLGQIAYQEETLKENRESLIKTKKEFEKMRSDFASELSNKYEDGVINIETGEITPQT